MCGSSAGAKLLLQRRAPVKENWPNKWDVSVAGHVGAGETAAEAAIREAREELGLSIDPLELQFIGSVREQCILHDGAYIDNEVHDVFVMRRELDLGALVLDPAEVAEVRLVAPGELQELDLVPHPDEYVLLRSVM